MFTKPSLSCLFAFYTIPISHLFPSFFNSQFSCLLYRYAHDTIQTLSSANHLCPHSIFHKWQPVTRLEMEGFFAIILNMGLINLPNIQDYWSTAWTNQVPFFFMLMTRERFQMIFWLLHVGHADSQPPRRIDKFKAFLEPLLENFCANYKPSCNICVDETMVGFHGHFGAKPNKPTKYGIKAFNMAASAHRYMLNIVVYTGADTLVTARTESFPASTSGTTSG